ncbi:MAG TPA: pyridoxamine 5'-phosphate oxidase family protein [Tepidiformaceae bacterium]|nr:pyridoxamine 5'-phosphate oxidase family protein [Tepidiformaceae bacterium]
MAGKMTRDEVHAFLDSRPGWIALTTISKSGHPHTVPIGYFRKGDEVFIGCRAGTQKLKNIERNPKVSLMLETGNTMQDIKGVCIQGTADIVMDAAEQLPLLRHSMALRGTPEDQLPTEARPGAAYIRIRPEKVISWDYAKPS